MNTRTVFLFVILFLGLTLIVRLRTDSRSEFVSRPESDEAVAQENKIGYASQDRGTNADLKHYRAGEYFDVPLNERRSIQNVMQATVLPYRSRLNDDFDVPLWERDRNSKVSQAPATKYRSHLDECFDVPLSERFICSDANQESIP
jgi:hypothetical protein